MSGIAAIMRSSANADDPNAHRELLAGMLARMAHRGRGPSSVHANALGGVAGVATSSDGACMIAADAELDDRAELARALELSEDITDAEMILEAYERWGTGAADRLVGDFAFCVLDTRARRLYAARDPFGVRTLYYHQDGRLFRCATEMTALFADGAVPRRPDLQQVALFLEDEYTETDATLYMGVLALPPAHQLSVTEGRVSIERYWQPDVSQRFDSDRDCARALRDTLLDATRRRLRASSAVGVFLSGGTDSATVTALAEQVRREGRGPKDKPVVLHASLQGLPDDETSYSEAVADMWQLPRINARPLDDREATRPAPIEGQPDIPYDPRNALWFPLLKSAHERGVDLALTGEGGDDVMQRSGVEIADALASGRWADALRSSGLARHPLARQSWQRVWRDGLRHLVPGELRRMVVRSPCDHEVLAPRYAAMVSEHRRTRAHAAKGVQNLNNRALCSMMARSYGHAALAWADRMAALHGMRLRHPFYDRRVVELLLSIPHDERHIVGLDKPKPVLRRAMQGLLPEIVLKRTGSGDYMEYLRTVLLEHHIDSVRALLTKSRLRDAGLVLGNAPDKLVTFDPHAPGGVTRLMRLRTAVAMEIWLRQV